MKPSLAFEPESFHWSLTPEWESEAGRDNPDYIHWVQSSLNKLLGLRLAVDGIERPATRSAIRSFQQRQGLTPDGIVSPQTEQQLRLLVGGSSPIAPSTSVVDPTDPRIDISAKFALMRMLKGDARSQNAAAGLIGGINSGALLGIFGDDLKASADLAQKLGTVRWKLIPPGEDAVLVLDPAAPSTAAIVFRGGEGEPPNDGVRRIPSRLDPALRKAWASFVLFRTGVLSRCKTPSGSCLFAKPSLQKRFEIRVGVFMEDRTQAT